MNNYLIKIVIIVYAIIFNNIVHANTSDIVKALQLYTQNHEILAKNIMNSDTPGFKALEAEDVKKYMKLTEHKAINLNTTHSNHLIGKQRSTIRIRKQNDAYQTKPNGNNVSIAQQMQKIAKNQLNHRTVNEVFAKTNKIILNALGKNG